MASALVIYDSIHGNTEQVARSIAAALGEGTRAVRATQTEPGVLADAHLLIVGSPTHGGRPSEAMKRFLAAIPAGGLQGVRVAAFDTRMEAAAQNPFLRAIVRFFGPAAPRIEKSLRSKGGTATVPAEGFFVLDREGPLKTGEVERAAAWARSISSSHES